ncbi:hypothetical protein DW927_13140 [Roseburia intestinalis]|uniref:Uncharacterized protein n=1 Tax=Roseburia intestinalis TaxID=166486 RepID=A0A3R6DWL5_9FIRM|nr:hypothetical protein DW927_13140 [Roseburia intestinalis]
MYPEFISSVYICISGGITKYLSPRPIYRTRAFFIHRKLRPMNEKALWAGCALRGEEVCCKQHRSGAKESQATLY